MHFWDTKTENWRLSLRKAVTASEAVQVADNRGPYYQLAYRLADETCRTSNIMKMWKIGHYVYN